MPKFRIAGLPYSKRRELKLMREGGATIRACADAFGISEYSAFRVIHHTWVNKESPRKNRKVTPAIKGRMRALRSRGVLLRDIAEKFDVSEACVSRHTRFVSSESLAAKRRKRTSRARFFEHCAAIDRGDAPIPNTHPSKERARLARISQT